MALLSLRRCAPLLLLLACLLPGRGNAQASEYDVKAAYLLNFLQYTTWPPAALGEDDPIVLCVLGTDPMGDRLLNATVGRRAQGRRVELLTLERAVEVNRCHAGFIAQQNRVPAAIWLDRLEGLPVLTIGEGPSFTREGGMIALVLDGGTVRFEVNRDALREAGLDLSSRVLRLARSAGD
ncbi:MAG TPA: YfiR family protein [Gemmatimonadales bacterium]